MTERPLATVRLTRYDIELLLRGLELAARHFAGHTLIRLALTSLALRLEEARARTDAPPKL